MADLGSCWSCTDDVTMPSMMASGNRCVAEAIVRRWITPRGGLIDDPNYGYDVVGELQDDLTNGDLQRIKANLISEAQKDERVIACAIQLTFVPTTGLLTIVATVTTANGPFTLVASVNDVTVQLLQVTP